MRDADEAVDSASGVGALEERARWIVGLGNPGPRYAPTRHNVGFRVIEELARRLDLELADGECRARLAVSDDVALVQPLTFMNRSGATLRCLAERHGLEAHDFLVVYDEIHLSLGRLRMRPKGSPAGHRGLESILEALGSDRVPRLRLGVAPAEGEGPEGEDLSEFVLAPFEAGEREEVDRMIVRAADAALLWAREGVEPAMQQFNG